MEMNNIYSVLMTAITTLGGAAAWRYYERRAERKERDEDWIKSDCKDRISKLEALLQQSSKEKDELRNIVLELTKEVAKLQTEVAFLQSQNKRIGL